MPRPHLSKAPIVEALLDVQVVHGGVSAEQLAEVQARILDRYPTKNERVRWQSSINFGDGSGPPPSRTLEGYLFRSADGLQVVQSRTDGFAFSRLAPYQDWATFRDEARLLWKGYSAIVKPSSITRLGLRFINRIELPRSTQDLREYFATVPLLAPTLPQRLSGLFMRLVIPSDTATAIVTQAIEDATITESCLPFILDIDTFVMGAFSDDETLWTEFEALHKLKNDVFFESVTPKTLEMFR